MRVLNTLKSVLVFLGIVLIPVFIIPAGVTEIIIFPKVILMSVLGSLLLVTIFLEIYNKKSLELTQNRFTLPVILLSISSVISAVVTSPDKMAAFFLPGNLTVIAASSIFFFGLIQIPNSQRLTKLAIITSALLSSVTFLLTYALLSKMENVPEVFRNPDFNLTGDLLTLTIFMLAALGLAIEFFLKEKEISKKLLFGVIGTIFLISLEVSASNIIANRNSLKLIPFSHSWEIFTESIKKNPFLGVGLSNYSVAFSKYRSLAFNSLPQWNTKYQTASNFYLTQATETGLVGVMVIVVLAFSLFRSILEDFNPGSANSWLLIGMTITSIFIPASPIFIFLLFIVLSINSGTSRQVIHLGKIFPTFLTIAAAGLVCLVVSFASKTLLSEYKFQKAVSAINQNQGAQSYDFLREAIKANSRVEKYHVAYSQVNFLLAKALSQKEDLTAEDKQNIARLISQAIREAKTAVFINPQKSSNWEMLAKIYQAIIPFAKGSDQFAISSFSQAIALDPINPDLRIGLGGVHFATGDLDNAIKAFELAVVAKPDLANSHYNLAIALREKGEHQRAISEMTTVLSLVRKDSNDYNLAKSQLQELEKNKPISSPAPEAAGELTPPQASPEPAISPPIELPEEANPPSQP